MPLESGTRIRSQACAVRWIELGFWDCGVRWLELEGSNCGVRWMEPDTPIGAELDRGWCVGGSCGGSNMRILSRKVEISRIEIKKNRCF